MICRFERVAKVNDVCWFEIRGTINTNELSPKTRYSAYIVFKEGFTDLPIEAGVGVVGKQVSKRFFCFDVSADGQFLKRGRRKWCFEKPKEREDGWREIELGRFFNKGGLRNSDEIEMSVIATELRHWKSGFILQGIEIRPETI